MFMIGAGHAQYDEAGDGSIAVPILIMHENLPIGKGGLHCLHLLLNGYVELVKDTLCFTCCRICYRMFVLIARKKRIIPGNSVA